MVLQVQLFQKVDDSTQLKFKKKKKWKLGFWFLVVYWSAIIFQLKYWNLKARWRHYLYWWKNCKVLKNDYSCQTSCQSMNNVHNAPLAKTLKTLQGKLILLHFVFSKLIFRQEQFFWCKPAAPIQCGTCGRI